MEKDTKTDPPSYPGSVPMVRIDGARIRLLRESKKLTQLYLSTVVGVTTDTISRWENRHYQSIKLENAEKLAQALEVPFDEILKQEEQIEPEPSLSGMPYEVEELPARTDRPRVLIISLIFLIALVSGVVIYSMLSEQPQATVSAERILPTHIPAGQSFPVLIRVYPQDETPLSLIIKESLPPGTAATHGVPAITSIDARENSLKWIGRTGTGKSVYAYMCHVPAGKPEDEELAFSGTVTLKQGGSDQHPIGGAVTVLVAPYHWADINRDNIIDDEEILSVYDTYSDIEELPFDRDLIDSLWASSRYVWAPESQQYISID